MLNAIIILKMNLIQIIIALICTLFAIYSTICIHKVKQIKISNKQQQQKINELHRQIENLENKKNNQQKIYLLKKEQNQKNLILAKQKIDSDIQNYKLTVINAANNYIDRIEDLYTATEDKYKNGENKYKQKIRILNDKIQEQQSELQKLKDTREAALRATMRQQEVRQNRDQYRLIPTAVDLNDIYRLQRVKKQLNKPRILSMLIWQTYWQPLAKIRFPVILKNKTVTGVYKITNQETNACYIGQAVDVYKRWCEHCKAGLGIDTPAGNKLYKAIQEYGLQNFTFELLTQCSIEELNAKEKYFISLYESNTYGYNSNIGISK